MIDSWSRRLPIENQNGVGEHLGPKKLQGHGSTELLFERDSELAHASFTEMLLEFPGAEGGTRAILGHVGSLAKALVGGQHARLPKTFTGFRSSPVSATTSRRRFPGPGCLSGRIPRGFRG